ncbi:MAG: M48 family metallopeptidase [Spirochaetia bacterium]|jgi:Zn-dependent protease with chaperone function
MGKDLTPAIKYLTDISPKAWEHPADRAALLALKQIPVIDEIIKKLFGTTFERAIRMLFLASSVRVTPRQFSKIHTLYVEACARLDVKQVPELYITQNPDWNAMAVGVDTPIIVFHSAFLKDLSDNEIIAVLGHELSHCLSGHVLYKTLLWLLLSIPLQLMGMFGLDAAIRLVIMALMEWDRKSELSADRAGLLAAQNADACFTLEMKLAGGPDTDKMNINEFFLQAEEYDKGGDVLDSLYKMFNILNRTHPFPVMRLAELKTWIDRGEYSKIMDGQYPRRGAEGPEDLFKQAQEAADQYKEDLKHSKDPLAGIVSELVKDAEPIANQVKDFFDNLLGGKSGEKQ